MVGADDFTLAGRREVFFGLGVSREMKAKTVFICQSCGAQSPKWLGRCPTCGEWNTLVEEIEEASARSAADRTGLLRRPSPSSTGTSRSSHEAPHADRDRAKSTRSSAAASSSARWS